MGSTIRLSGALTAASILLLVVSGYLPWMAPAPDATQIPSIGSYLFGYELALIEISFLIVATIASAVTLVLSWNQVKGGLLCAFGVGYAVLPHYLIAQQSARLPRVFEPTIVGPALASAAGCLAVAAGTILLRDSVQALR